MPPAIERFIACRFLGLLWVVLTLGVAMGNAQASPLTLVGDEPYAELAGKMEYLEDPEGQMTLEQVRGATGFRTTPQGENPNFGYSRSAYWLRLTVTNGTAVPRDWVLEISYPSLDFVDWYAPVGDAQGYRRHQAGDRYLFSVRSRPHYNLVFPVELQADATQTFYLRVASEGTMTVPARLWRADQFTRTSEQSHLVLGLYFGTMLALFLYNLMLYVSLRDRVLLQYVGYVGGFIVGIAAMNGLGTEFLWGNVIWWTNASLVAGLSFSIFCAVQFARSFTECARLSRPTDQVLKASALLAAATFAASMVLPYHIASIMLALTALFFPPAAFYAGWLAWRRKVPGARFFLLAWALMLLTILTLAMRNFGWLPSTFLTNNGMQIGSLVEALLLSFSLADRYNRLAVERNAAQADALATREAMVKALKEQEQVLEQEVADRTRELQAANEELRGHEQQLAALSLTDSLTGIANRRRFDEALAIEWRRGRRHGQPVALGMIDVDWFKRYNDHYGHQAGDECLRSVASALGGCIGRSGELIARYGGEEFAFILPGADQEQAMALAIRARNAVRALMYAHTESAFGIVTISVGVAVQVPHTNEEPSMLLLSADQALYQAKAEGRNRVVLAP